MNEKIEGLRKHLLALTFAQVTHTVAKDSNLSSFTDGEGVTIWSDYPDFEERRNEMSRDSWIKTYKSYSFYFGFAQAESGSVHFDSKGQASRSEDYAGLGVDTNQYRCSPPCRNQWIVGSVINPERPHYFRWARCTEQEKLFAEFLVSGKTQFSEADTRRLFINRAISDGKPTNHLINMAMILLARDVGYYLEIRRKHGGKCIDGQVFGVCEKYDPEFWEEYKRKALEQALDPVLKYSELIPAPAPKPIIDRRDLKDGETSVGLNTPFASLNLKL